jgi:hypothetical protein
VLVGTISAGILLATGLFTLWILLGIWRYGDLIVFEPSKPILALEIIMALWASMWSGLVLVVCLYLGVKKLWC